MPRKPLKKEHKNYKRNFLKEVILRLDFNNAELDFLSDFAKSIKHEFPYFDQQKVLGNPIKIVGGGFLVDQLPQQNLLWIFSNLDKTKKLQIAPDHIALTYTRYKNSNELLQDVAELVLPFILQAKIETLNRVGLRYSNEINLNNIKTKFSWSQYLSGHLIGSLNFASSNKMKVARSVGKLSLKEEDADITFNFGVWNSDYPNEALRKEFLLDYDCYSMLPIGTTDTKIIDVVRKYNSYIERLFESSITDNLRDVLNNKKK